MGGAELAIRDLEFEATATANPAELRMRGTAEGAIVDRLSALVDDFHAQLVAGSAREVTIDLRAVEFMNAHCFNVLVTWTRQIAVLEPERRYQLRFVIDPDHPWQQRSVDTLARFAPGIAVLAS